MTNTSDAIKAQPTTSVGRLPGSVESEVGQPPTVNPDAHDLYLSTAEGAAGEYKPLDGTKALAVAPGSDRPLFDSPVERIEPFTPGR